MPHYARRFTRRDDMLAPVMADPLATMPADTVVADVVAVEPIMKTFRATVTRTITQTAVVEFTAAEGTDQHSMAQSLLETIPPESWVDQPADSWGYIDRIEEVVAADPLADPAATLSRRYARKGLFEVADNGNVVGTFEAATADDAILGYIAEQGYASIDEMATALGVAVEDLLLQITAADVTPVDPAADPLLDPAATLSRRRALARRYARKGMFEVSDNGAVVGTFEAATADDAILGYVVEQGYATIDDMAAALGITVDDLLMQITALDVTPVDPALDPLAA